MLDLLLEIGIEEVPVTQILPAVERIGRELLSRLQERGVATGNLETAATNRRWMIHIEGVAEHAATGEEKVLGPAKKIAIDESGHPTRALEKFLESQKVPLSQVVEIEAKKGTYLGVIKIIGGEDTADLLAELVPEVLGSLTFPKTMVWNDSGVPFVRPIRTLVLLLGNRPIQFQFAGVTSGTTVRGHLLLSEADLEVGSFKDYIEGLTRNFVVLSGRERREKIQAELAEVEEELSAKVQLDDDMLHYHVFNNEYPVVFTGEFDPRYLTLPREIIATFMIHEKKLIPLLGADGKLLPAFAGVANIPDENGRVRKGNEKVIAAAFEDATFFWENDRRDDFYGLRQALKNVQFQKDLGSYYDKSQRLAALCDYLVRETGHTQLAEPLQKAAFHCKNDLITRMVREFPSLQGIMGGLYLAAAGEDETVWKAVYGHYLPRGAEGEKLTDLGAGLLSVADRLDNIAAFLSRGVKVSSSKDPYGLRRDAGAVVKIALDFRLHIPLEALLRMAALQFAKSDETLSGVLTGGRELFLTRFESFSKENLGLRYDVVNAALAGGSLDLYDLFLKADAVRCTLEAGPGQDLVQLHKRLKNIIKKAPASEPSGESLVEPAEKLLFDILRDTRERVGRQVQAHDYLEAATAILEMKPVVDRFFTDVLVMAEDEKLRTNRLALLQTLERMISSIADYSQIVEN